MLTRAIGLVVAAILLPLLAVAPRASADGGTGCPSGTHPVSVGSGVICVVVTAPESDGNIGSPGGTDDTGGTRNTGGGGNVPAGCYNHGVEIPCHTNDGDWWPSRGCYAAQYDAPSGSPAWQGHTNGSLWQCTICATAGTTGTCTVHTIWLAPNEDRPAPPTPEQLAATAYGQLRLLVADVHIAPAPPAPTYVGVENWLWIPESQWSTLSKSVTAGPTTVTVRAAPSEVAWTAGPKSLTCAGPGVAWVKGMTDAASTPCSVTFEQSSADEPHGVFAVSAVIRYAVTWSCSGACSTAGGNFGLVDAPAGAGELTVLQRQTVVVQ